MRSPNVQLFTVKPFEIHGIADGARLYIESHDGHKLYDLEPDNVRFRLSIAADNYPVLIRIHKMGYVSLTLRGLASGELVQEVI